MSKHYIRSILAAAGLFVLALAPGAQAACQISGPNTANADQSFTLCGPAISGSTYEWQGQSITSNTYARCIGVDGLARGTYQFVLIRRVNDVEVERCTKVVNVGGSTGGVESCNITGPESINQGMTATLCSPQDGLHEYTWTAPNGTTSNAGCISVSEDGTYSLVSRNRITGSSRTCMHRLTVVGSSGGSAGMCDITGPTTIPAGSAVQLCAPSLANTTYRWAGPDGLVSTDRCINADAGGTYYLVMRNVGSGRTTRCSQAMTVVDQGSGGGNEDADSPVTDICPRGFQFWRIVSNQSSSVNGADLTRTELIRLARAVDDKSTYLNWANDVDGFRQALNPGRPLTKRKQIIRQFVALLANVAAGDMGVTAENGSTIGIDADAAVNFGGARTVGELIALTDRLLRANRGDFTKLNATLNQLNRGRGIGSTCD